MHDEVGVLLLLLLLQYVRAYLIRTCCCVYCVFFFGGGTAVICTCNACMRRNGVGGHGHDCGNKQKKMLVQPRRLTSTHSRMAWLTDAQRQRQRDRETAVVRGQKRLTRCFRQPEVASQKHKELPKTKKKRKRKKSRAGAYGSAMATSPMKARISPNICCSPLTMPWTHDAMVPSPDEPMVVHGRCHERFHGQRFVHGLFHGTVHGSVVCAMEHAMVFMPWY